MENQTTENEAIHYRIFLGLISSILIILVYQYIRFIWGRRKLYISSWNVPGPLSFPLLGNIHLFYRGSDVFVKLTENLARTYPYIFRIWMGPHLLYCILKPEYIEKILCNKLEKSRWVYDILSTDFTGDGLIFSRVTTWKRHRKLIQPSFGQKTLDSYIDKFNERADILRDLLQKHIGETSFDLRKKFFNYTVDIICETLMGVNVDFQTTNSGAAKDLSRILQILVTRIYCAWYHIDLIWKLTPLYKELCHLNKKIKKEYFMCAIFERMNEPKNSIFMDDIQDEFQKKLPFLDWILQTTDFTETEMIDEVYTFMGAGSDTMTSALNFCVIMMGMYQDIQERVYEEVLAVCGPERRISASDINQLKYFERVVKETLRIFPPAPFILREIDADLDLGELVLPKGSSSMFIIRTIHTNPKYWPNPYQFDPDRFLPENVARRHPCAYIPFSYGSRNCIGFRFAMMEILTTLSILIRKFKFFTEYKTIEEIELIPSIVLELKYGEKVRLELR